MEFEIRNKDKVIGTTKLESCDPPMGFVFGVIFPSEDYSKELEYCSLKLYLGDTLIKCNSITIEDLTQELGETSIEITVLIESSEEFEKYFKHHSETYENQFK